VITKAKDEIYLFARQAAQQRREGRKENEVLFERSKDKKRQNGAFWNF